MFKRICLFTGLIAFLLTSCNAPTNSSNTLQSLELGTMMPEETIDGHFAKLGQILPGFGGFFYDGKGKLNVMLTEAYTLEQVRASIVEVFGKERFQRTPTERNKLIEPDGLATITLVKGTYTVLELLRWSDQAIDIMSLDGVVSLDMDEVQNRVVVGHTEEARLEELQDFLSKHELPLEAFVFEVEQPIEPFQSSVSDIFRPIPGGVRILGDFRGCTLGFNAVRNGVEGFVTNAHCIASPTTTFYQPAWPQVVAYNSFTPSGFTNGLCPASRVCFFSDSGFVSYMSRGISNIPGSLPQAMSLARPVLWNGRLDLPFPDARFSILGSRNFSIVGEELDKVGRTTGWTFGVVTETCRRIDVRNSTNTLLCQDIVTRRTNQTFMIAAKGDSGSPAFFWDGGTGATIVGLIWGGSDDGTTFSLSPLSNITLSRELGPLTLRSNTISPQPIDDDPTCPPAPQQCQ